MTPLRWSSGTAPHITSTLDDDFTSVRTLDGYPDGSRKSKTKQKQKYIYI